ncbi:MAG: 3-hydroxybutyryl-CoA dehydrogenase [Haloferacaceae archaeon]|jgi:3-hydroxyacyl-CoA dehydrogenase (EC 1.1.1.35)
MFTVDGVETVGVVGAGTMGAGIAQVAATAGYEVVMRDVETAYVERGFESIEDSLARLVGRDTLDQETADAARDRITGTTELTDLADADLVVEAVLEDMEIKQDVFADLDEITSDGTVLATNTSTLSVTTIAGATDRPGDVVGLHFMNPVPVMEGVEVVVGETTDDGTVSLVHEFAESLDKTTWESADRPGFVVNRVLIPWVCEGIEAYDEGVASKEDVDTGLKLGTNVPMGPLELGDHIGLDVVLDAAETLHAELGDKYRPPVLLRRKVDAGHLGKKTGKGFYEYE